MPLPADRIDQVRDRLDAKDAGALIALGASAYLPLIEAAGPVSSARDRLTGLNCAELLQSRLEAIDAIVAAVGDRAQLTLDPTERHGFEYQRWIGFSLFGAGLSGEIGRGGTYSIVDAQGGEEEAVGFSLYLDPLVDAGLGQEIRQRVFAPFGSDPATSASLRAQGWITIAGLSENDDGRALGCSHYLAGNEVLPY